MLSAITFVATTGCTRARPPPAFGLFTPTAYRRFTEWSRARVWANPYRPARKGVEPSKRLGRHR